MMAMDTDENVQPPYSVHSFMLPFRWDYLPKGFSFDKGRDQFSFEERTDLRKFLQCLLDSNSRWKRKFYRIDGKKEKYNEFHYFHSYASRTIFDLQQHDEPESTDVHANKVMLYFEYQTDPDNDKYIITYYKKKDSGESDKYAQYHLTIRDISLHVYNTGIGILSINLKNDSYRKQADVFKINELGRKLYPRYLTEGVPATKEIDRGELAKSIELSVMGAGLMVEDYSDYANIDDREVYHYQNDQYIQSWVVRLPTHIRKLFTNRFKFNTGSWEEDTIGVSSLTDYRMFFLCWYGNKNFSDDLKQKEHSYFDPLICKHKNRYRGNWYSYPHKDDLKWYNFLMGDEISEDKDEVKANRKKINHLIKKHTYTRWVGRGTLLGITLNSFVALSSPRNGDADKQKPDIHTNMKNVYYQIATLCLAQRTSVLRFSAEITSLSDLARSNKNKKLIANIKVLYKNYIEFMNKLYYREVTGHFSGIELYKQFQEVMELKDEVKALDDELNDLFNYIRLEEQEKQGDEAHKLNKVASWFLPASFLAALLGISFKDIKELFTWHPAFDWLFVIGIGYLISFIILKITKK